MIIIQIYILIVFYCKINRSIALALADGIAMKKLQIKMFNFVAHSEILLRTRVNCHLNMVSHWILRNGRENQQ